MTPDLPLRQYPDDVVCAAAYRFGLHDLNDLYSAVMTDPMYARDLLEGNDSDDPRGALCEIIDSYMSVFATVPYVHGDPKSEDLARHLRALEAFSLQLPGRSAEDAMIVARAVLTAALGTRRDGASLQAHAAQAAEEAAPGLPGADLS